MREKYASDADYQAHADAFSWQRQAVTDGAALNRNRQFLQTMIDGLKADIARGKTDPTLRTQLATFEEKLAKLDHSLAAAHF